MHHRASTSHPTPQSIRIQEALRIFSDPNLLRPITDEEEANPSIDARKEYAKIADKIMDVIKAEQILNVIVFLRILEGVETIWICGGFSEESRNKVYDAVTRCNRLERSEALYRL